MKYERGDFTVGDVGCSITITTDQDLTGRNVDFYFIKPTGGSIIKDSTSVSTYTATYTFASGDLDVAGDWYVYLYDATAGFFYNEDGTNRFRVKPKPFAMAV